MCSTILICSKNGFFYKPRPLSLSALQVIGYFSTLNRLACLFLHMQCIVHSSYDLTKGYLYCDLTKERILYHPVILLKDILYHPVILLKDLTKGYLYCDLTKKGSYS